MFKEKVAGLQALGLLRCVAPETAAGLQHPDELVHLLVECGEAVSIDFTASGLEAPEFYRPAFEALKDLHEDVDFELRQLDLESREYEGGTAGTVTVVIQQAGLTYAQQLRYLDKIRVDHHFHRLVNRALADAGSEYRLFRLYLSCENCPTNLFGETGPLDPERMATLALTRDQAQAIQEGRLLSMCCDDFTLLTTAEVERAIETFQAVGLLDGLSESDLVAARATVSRTLLRNASELLLIFEGYDDSMLYWLDPETSNFENPYEEILLGLADASRGEFQPTAIVDEWAYGEDSKLSFELKGKRYETTLTNRMEWLDLSFIALVNEALQDQGVGGRFYLMDGLGQDVSVVFLTEDQYEQIEESGLLSLVPR